MADAMAVWTKMEIDRESDGGYEKTTKVGEYPAIETYTNEGKAGQLQVFVAGRFLVAVSTQNVPADQLKKIGEELKLENLAAQVTKESSYNQRNAQSRHRLAVT